MDLHQLFDDVVSDREPPTRMTAQSVYAAGRRRARLRSTTGLGAVGAAAVAVVAVFGTVLHTPNTAAAPVPSASPSIEASGPVRYVAFTWAAAGDANHLYATAQTQCTVSSTCLVQLYGSDDGGRTWTKRGVSAATSPYVAGPTTLVSWGTRRNLSDPSVSTDGGRHWNKITVTDTPVPSVPAGGFAACVIHPEDPVTTVTRCHLYAIDVAGHRAAPLAAQPPLNPMYNLPPTSVGSRELWVNGVVTSSGAAVAVSSDSGRTWRTTTVDPQCAGPGLLWHATGPTGKLLCQGHANENRPHLFATADAGLTWHEIPLPQPIPNLTAQDESNFLFGADGTLVAELFPRDDSGVRFWTLDTTAGAWHPIQTSGLPTSAMGIQPIPGGGYLTYTNLDDHYLYRSPDLKTWTRIRYK